MKIGIVTTWFERGAAYVSRQYADILTDAGHEVFIYARGGEGSSRDGSSWSRYDVTHPRRSAIPVGMVLDLDHFARWIREKGIETVFFNEERWFRPALLCRDLGVRTGAYIDYYTEETVPFHSCYDFLICNTKRHFSAFAWHPFAAYVPWGTDLELFKPSTHQLVDGSCVTFFHSSGYSPQRKGTDLLLKATSRLTGPARLIIHTQVPLEPLFPELRTTLAGLVSEGRLEIRCSTVPAPGLYHLGDVYVYPSRIDGLGLTVAEAYASGLPVIGTDFPPINEFVTPENGALVETERIYSRRDGYYWPVAEVRVASLAEKMQDFIDRCVDVPQWKAKARRHAEASLDWMANKQRIDGIFQNAAPTPRKDDAPHPGAIRAYDHRQLDWKLRLSHRFPRVYDSLRRVLRARERSLTGS